jgi:hypothetical protein
MGSSRGSETIFVQKAVLFLAIVFAFGWSPSRIASGATLDQSSFRYAQDGVTNLTGAVGGWATFFHATNGRFAAQAQTFTPAASGRLMGVGVQLEAFITDPVPEPLFLSVRHTSGGVPGDASGDILGTTVVGDVFYSIDLAGVRWGSVRYVDTSGLNIRLLGGEQYALVMYSFAAVPTAGPFSGVFAPYGWQGVRIADQYPGGRALFSSQDEPDGPFSWTFSAVDHDHFFQTFMEVTEVPLPGGGALFLVGLACALIAARRQNRITPQDGMDA